MSWPGALRLFWISVFAAVIAVGAWKRGKLPPSLPLADRGPDSSVNSILSRTLAEADAAPRLTQWLSELPGRRPILLLVAPDQTRATLTADLVSYQAWPRPVVVSPNRQRSFELLQNAPDRYCAVGFCYLDPPPGGTRLQSFGSRLTFITSGPKTE